MQTDIVSELCSSIVRELDQNPLREPQKHYVNEYGYNRTQLLLSYAPLFEESPQYFEELVRTHAKQIGLNVDRVTRLQDNNSADNMRAVYRVDLSVAPSRKRVTVIRTKKKKRNKPRCFARMCWLPVLFLLSLALASLFV